LKFLPHAFASRDSARFRALSRSEQMFSEPSSSASPYLAMA